MRNDHRLWPVPSEPWIMKQEWHDLLFAHWPVPVEVLRPLVPEQLPLDVLEGQAWVGVTPFVLRGLRPRGIPRMPGLSEFPETNVRTYVTVGGKPGVYFFSLDAASRAAVVGARIAYGLPYFSARMRAMHVCDQIIYRTARETPPGTPAEFLGRYRPVGPVFHSEIGSLEYWLTERYCLYSVDRKGKIWRAEIHHDPWPLQRAEAKIRENSMAEAASISLPDTDPLLHFSKFLDVRIWRPVKVPDDEIGQG